MIYLQYIKTFGGNVETLYDILEVSRRSTKEVIEKAYKTLAKNTIQTCKLLKIKRLQKKE